MKKELWIVLLIPFLLYAQEQVEIEVQGKKVPLNFDSKKDVWIIEGKTLTELPSLNLADLLRFAANLSFVCRGFFQSDTQGLGFNQEQFTVLVDGVPVNNSQTGHHNLILPLHTENIKRIEILRGSFSPVLSSAGPGGVINIITSRENAVHFSLSSFQTLKASINLGSNRLFFSSGLKSTGGYMEGIDGNEYFSRAGIRIPIKNSILDIQGSWMISKFGAFNFYAPYPSFENLSKIWGSLYWRMSLTQNATLFLKSSTRYSKDIFHLYRESPELYSNTHNTFQNTVETGITLNKETFSACLGLSAFLDSINSSGIRNGESGSALGEHRRSLFSFFGEAGRETKSLFLNGGIRFTEGTNSGLSGHVLLGTYLGSSWQTFFSLNRTFRFPTYTELYYSDPSHLSNPGLKAEKSWGTNFSLKQQGDMGDITFRIFFHLTENLIDWNWNPGLNMWNSANIQEGKHTGFEADYSLRKTSFQLNVLYTFQKACFKHDTGLNEMKYHYYFPEHSLSVLFQKDLSLFSLYWVMKLEKERLKSAPTTALNIKILKPVGHFFIYLEILNLFNTRMEKIPGLPEAPRSFSIGAKYIFTK
ncbi:MAG: TonB-dependent receptor [Candidatus Aminicenantes bacterium]|nr:TonB-dependent receptor [Candidatus Aminicenantes bacterium]